MQLSSSVTIRKLNLVAFGPFRNVWAELKEGKNRLKFDPSFILVNIILNDQQLAADIHN